MIANRAWCALGSAAVLATAAGGCDRGAGGHARAQRLGALATAVVADADGDDSGSELDTAEDLASTGIPDAEAPEAEGVPDAVAVDDAGGSGDENDQDVGSPSSGDDSGSSSGSDSDSGIVIIIIDSGSVAPPSQTVDASVESGGVPESGNETSGPASPDGGRPTGAPQGGGVSLHGPLVGAADLGGPSIVGDDADAPASGDDTSNPSFDDAAPPWGGGPSGDDGGSPNLDLPPSRAVIGCAGCSVPDAPNSGALAWLMVALTLGLRSWRRR